MYDYLGSIQLLSDEVSEVLGKVVKGTDSVFFENKNRRLYIVRPKVGDETTENYMPSDLKKQSKKWEIKS